MSLASESYEKSDSFKRNYKAFYLVLWSKYLGKPFQMAA